MAFNIEAFRLRGTYTSSMAMDQDRFVIKGGTADDPFSLILTGSRVVTADSDIALASKNEKEWLALERLGNPGASATFYVSGSTSGSQLINANDPRVIMANVQQSAYTIRDLSVTRRINTSDSAGDINGWTWGASTIREQGGKYFIEPDAITEPTNPTFYVSASGNVGIKNKLNIGGSIRTPKAELDLSGNMSASGDIFLTGSAKGYHQIKIGGNKSSEVGITLTDDPSAASEGYQPFIKIQPKGASQNSRTFGIRDTGDNNWIFAVHGMGTVSMSDDIHMENNNYINWGRSGGTINRSFGGGSFSMYFDNGEHFRFYHYTGSNNVNQPLYMNYDRYAAGQPLSNHIGIGMTAATMTKHVLDVHSNPLENTYTTSSLSVDVYGNTVMAVSESSAKVGVGIGNPAAKLDVSGSIILRGLPGSDPGVAGQLWNSSGTLKVSAG